MENYTIDCVSFAFLQSSDGASQILYKVHFAQHQWVN